MESKKVGKMMIMGITEKSNEGDHEDLFYKDDLHYGFKTVPNVWADGSPMFSQKFGEALEACLNPTPPNLENLICFGTAGEVSEESFDWEIKSNNPETSLIIKKDEAELKRIKENHGSNNDIPK